MVKNWRPIILLCADYKLLSKVVANRIRSTLDSLISEEQFGFIPGRNIQNNIRRTVDGIQMIRQQKLNACLLMVDFEKAFDRVEYKSLLQVMQYFNFGAEIIAWVQLHFTGFRLCVINNRNTSAFLVPTRGLFQGNPISSIGFILIIELLTLLIKANSKIQGIQIGHINLLLSMFADDVSIFLPNNVANWVELKSTLGRFEDISGLKINYDKTLVYRIGNSETCIALKYAMKYLNWTDGPINILGLLYDEDQSKMQRINLEPIFKHAEALTKLWKMRDLSMMGSITAFNALVASLFVYKISNLNMLEKKYIIRFNDLLHEFIWKGKKPKIKLMILQGNKDDGGLQLCNIQHKDMSLKIQWIFRLMKNESLKNIAYSLMGNKLGDLILRVQLRAEHFELLRCENLFWTDVLRIWLKVNYEAPISNQQVKEQVIWFNSNIKVDNKPFIFRKWYENGISQIKDLLDDEGNFLSYRQLANKFSLSLCL